MILKALILTKPSPSFSGLPYPSKPSVNDEESRWISKTNLSAMPAGLTLLLQGDDLSNVTFINQILVLECILSKHLKHFDTDSLASVEASERL